MKKIFSLLLIGLLLIPRLVLATDYTADANCLGAWLMDIDEDPLTDSSGEGNTAALRGDGEPDFATASPPAAYSTGYYVWGGSDDYALVTDFIASNQSFVSICAWAYFDTDNTDDYIVRFSSTPGGNGLVIFRDDTDSSTGRTDCITILIAASTDYRLSTATNSAVSGQWYYICFTFSSVADELSCYIDGVEDANSPNTGGNGQMVNPAADMLIGATATGVSTGNLDGRMDETAYFDRALDSTEVNDIMDNGLVGGGAPPAGDDSGVYIISKLQPEKLNVGYSN